MSNMSNTMRDAAKDVRDAAKETSKAASAGLDDIQSDLKALQEDVADLTQQLAKIVTTRGSAAWRHAKSNVDDMISDAGERGREAIGAVREVGDNVVDAIDESLKKRPYTTLAIAAGLGFLFGATWRR